MTLNTYVYYHQIELPLQLITSELHQLHNN
ncbi:MAG: hypothetical protein RL411_852 [Bacteroidota bacterium]|jgi:hypothetical protein